MFGRWQEAVYGMRTAAYDLWLRAAPPRGLYLEGELKSCRQWLRIWERETAEMGAEDLVEAELVEAGSGAQI